jgi:prolyl 4-hydroxylase
MIYYSSNNELPPLLEKGYIIKTLPKELFNQVDNLYQKSKKFTREERKDEALSVTGKSELSLVSRFGYLRDNLMNDLLPLHEEVFKVSLIPEVMFGVRTYFNGSMLGMHYDKFVTHHVGSIICVDKDLNGADDWPLHLIDYQGKEQLIYLNVGDIVFYESAKLLHGRPTPLEGNSFSILMYHLSIDGYKFRSNDNLF